MKLIIEMPDKSYEAFQELIAINIGRGCGKGIIQTALNAIKNGVPLKHNHPVVVNEDGETAYLTQGHINALLEYEEGKRMERVLGDVMKNINGAIYDDTVGKDGK